MTKLLLSIHVLAAIVAVGPVAVAASMFPAALRRALATATAAPLATAGVAGVASPPPASPSTATSIDDASPAAASQAYAAPPAASPAVASPSAASQPAAPPTAVRPASPSTATSTDNASPAAASQAYAAPPAASPAIGSPAAASGDASADAASPALDVAGGGHFATLRALHRICRVYSAVGVVVPVFGLATASSLGVLTDPWVLVSIGLTVAAAGVLGLLVLPGQRSALAGRPGPISRLAMYTGLFNLLWAVVTALMITRPGSTTGV